jgi:RNAse (barnase) inhibitor barstar
MPPHTLRSLGTDQFHRLIGSRSEATDYAWALERDPDANTTVRILRGAKMTSEERLYDEFAASLQFPYYFGENWDALDECLRDLDWLSGDAYVLILLDASRILSSEDRAQLPTLIRVLKRARDEWSQAVTEGQSWDRAAKPFHVVFHAEPSEARLLRTLFPTVTSEIALSERE